MNTRRRCYEVEVERKK